uniref:DNA-damage-inducible protein D n=1 Tax=Candidatus Kentrum sp. LFY TaxID=2126342 RepID=A0A450W6V6_9GAMM|nr:MAG: DNA-damage-inducible protein D [Candidatus Kentron sp. LFY]
MQALFVFDNERNGFESFVNSNGDAYWYASDLATMLGYESYRGAFSKAIQKAMTACATLEISIQENFKEERRIVNDEKLLDYRLSRFACYLTSVNADVSKPQVAGAQRYFLTLAEAFRQYYQTSDNVERVLVREEITQQEKSLSNAAKNAGVTNYAFFRDSGYRGMYNMSLNELKRHKGYSGKRPLLDFMGKTELAANLFRITQTEQKIHNDRIKGQSNLEITAHQVGKKVRNAIQDISGSHPEDLPLAEDIKKVRSGIKRTNREFQKLDKQKK